MLHENSINSLVNMQPNMSDVTCHDCLVGSQMFHGSHVLFRVHIRVPVASHDI